MAFECPLNERKARDLRQGLGLGGAPLIDTAEMPRGGWWFALQTSASRSAA